MNEYIMKNSGFKEEINLVDQGCCPICKCDVIGFRDELSLKEFKISGLCQDCQDKVFE